MYRFLIGILCLWAFPRGHRFDDHVCFAMRSVPDAADVLHSHTSEMIKEEPFMKTNRILALLLAIALVATLFAGCEIGRAHV